MLNDLAGYTRRHPARLPSEAYCIPGIPVSFVLCSKYQRTVFTTRDAPGVIGESLHVNAQNQGIDLRAYCLMPDHLHLVAQVSRDGGNLLRFLHGFKTWTGRVLPSIGFPTPVWQRSFWDRHLRRDEPLRPVIAYVVRNPAEEGLCDDWRHWPYMWLDRPAEEYGLWE